MGVAIRVTNPPQTVFQVDGGFPGLAYNPPEMLTPLIAGQQLVNAQALAYPNTRTVAGNSVAVKIRALIDDGAGGVAWSAFFSPAILPNPVPNGQQVSFTFSVGNLNGPNQEVSDTLHELTIEGQDNQGVPTSLVLYYYKT